MNLWEQIKTHLSPRLSGESYQNWLAETSFRGIENGTLYVGVPNEATRAWMQEEYADLISSAIRSLQLPVTSTVYELGNGNGVHRPERTIPETNGSETPAAPLLNPK